MVLHYYAFDWLKCHYFNHLEVNPKLTVTCLHAFSRACFTALLASVVNGQSVYFGVGLKTLN